MRIKLPKKWERRLQFWRHKLLPRTLFFRTMLLIFVPLIVVQVVSVVVFFDGSWSRMGRRLSDGLVDDINVLINLKEQGMSVKDLEVLAANSFDIRFSYYDKTGKNDFEKKIKPNPMVVAYLEEALIRVFPNDKWGILVDDKRGTKNNLVIWVERSGGVYQIECPKKKIFSSSIFMFVVWMVATSILLFLVSVLFLRIQVRAIADLAQTAENFGKGVDDDGFKPYGSSEVRKAGTAFIEMKERILRQIMERTQMLAGISHDLRTPLTRMKLMVTMMDDYADKQDFLSDIDEMEKMLNGYLAFVRGEGEEQASDVDVKNLVEGIVGRFVGKKIKISFIDDGEDKKIVAKEQALRRAITNIVGNASRYGKKIEVSLKKTNKSINIVVDDNGPGIPKDKREEVFRAFYRLENSRNKETGGIGLGLAITKDIITSHGGKISLEDSNLGGLRVLIELPF